MCRFHARQLVRFVVVATAAVVVTVTPPPPLFAAASASTPTAAPTAAHAREWFEGGGDASKNASGIDQILRRLVPDMGAGADEPIHKNHKDDGSETNKNVDNNNNKDPPPEGDESAGSTSVADVASARALIKQELGYVRDAVEEFITSVLDATVSWMVWVLPDEDAVKMAASITEYKEAMAAQQQEEQEKKVLAASTE